jgi:hypothetical protein
VFELEAASVSRLFDLEDSVMITNAVFLDTVPDLREDVVNVLVSFGSVFLGILSDLREGAVNVVMSFGNVDLRTQISVDFKELNLVVAIIRESQKSCDAKFFGCLFRLETIMAKWRDLFVNSL